MWIFTSQGFISAVQHRDKPDTLIVRARRAEHLEDIVPGSTVRQDENADYRYRCEVKREGFKLLIADYIDDLDYDNFKNSIADHEYHDACTGVWTVMHRLQPGSLYHGVTLQHEYADLWAGDDDSSEPPPDEDSSEAAAIYDAPRTAYRPDYTTTVSPLLQKLAREQGGDLAVCEDCGVEYVVGDPFSGAESCADCTPGAA